MSVVSSLIGLLFGFALFASWLLALSEARLTFAWFGRRKFTLENFLVRWTFGFWLLVVLALSVPLHFILLALRRKGFAETIYVPAPVYESWRHTSYRPWDSGGGGWCYSVGPQGFKRR